MLQPTGRVSLPPHNEQVTLLLLGIVDNGFHLMAGDNLVIGLDPSSFCLLAGLGLNRLLVPERFGLHLLDFIEGGSIPGDLFDDGDEMDLCPIVPGQINGDSHGLVCTWRTIVCH